MQLRFETNLSVDEYVNQKAWRYAELNTCPLHPEGGCSLAKHGTYSRKLPPGTKIARWYCPEGCTTFSLLPDCLAARLPGSLVEIEIVLNQVQASPSQEAAADDIRENTEHAGALRWIRRRLFLVQASLAMLIELISDFPEDFTPTLPCFQELLGFQFVLPELRGYAHSHLEILPPPIGFGPYPKKKKIRFQHKTGTDPPQKCR